MLPKLLIAIGFGVIAVGVVMLYAPWLLSWFGRLPGDINIERGGARVFIPITSMIIISVVLSLIVNFFFRR
jgi:Protein of unknown function (DUF2905)